MVKGVILRGTRVCIKTCRWSSLRKIPLVNVGSPKRPSHRTSSLVPKSKMDRAWTISQVEEGRAQINVSQGNFISLQHHDLHENNICVAFAVITWI
jgi:hypothetical protein